MELKYTKTSLVQQIGGYVHMVDGVEKVDDLMVTYYRPTNFEGTVKDFVLGCSTSISLFERILLF